MWPFGKRSKAALGDNPGSVASFIHRQQRPPTRDQAGVLAAFRSNPRLYSVASRVADGVASPEWKAYRASKKVYRDFRSRNEHERREIKQDLEEISTSQTLALWNRSSPDMTAHQIRRTIQLHLDLTGDSYSVLERNLLGLPAFLYPLNPVWVLPPNGRALIGGERQYLVNGGGFTSKNFPASQIFAIRLPDPNDPYGRGSGVGTALANEIDIDEYAAQSAAAKMFNGGMPDWFIKLEGLGVDELEAYKQKFQDEFRGPTKAGKLKFTNAKSLEAIKLDQSIVDMDLVELRRFAAEVIRESFGVPPEIMGNVDNSNRATISAAYFLFATLCLVPRLRVLEDAVNQSLVPLMGEEDQVFITYDSPVPEDEEAEAEMVKALPRAFTTNEIRCKGGAEPRDDGDDLYSDIEVTEQPAVDSEDEIEEEGETEKSEPEAEATPADANVKDPAASANSLNGAQVTAAKEIVLDVAYGRLPRESGKSMLMSFFGLTDEQAEQILGAVGKTFEPAPEGGVSPPDETAPTASIKTSKPKPTDDAETKD